MEDEKLHLDYNEIKNYLRIEYPLLMVDYADEVYPGKSSKAIKNLTNNEWFFQCHFPGNPVMPGTLEIESIFQTAALAIHTLPGNKEKTSYLVRADKLMYLGFARPGDVLRIETFIQRWKYGVGKGYGEIYVRDKVICRLNFVLAIEDDIVSLEK